MSNLTQLICRTGLNYVIGPDGSPLSISDLPSSDTVRWVVRKKAKVVCAVLGGIISLSEVCERYTLTIDEFLTWQATLDRHGVKGLRVTRINNYQG